MNKECENDKILNPKTNKCVSKTGKIGKELLKKLDEKKECEKDKILNPKTNKCVSKTGKIGKELLKKLDEKKELNKKIISKMPTIDYLNRNNSKNPIKEYKQLKGKKLDEKIKAIKKVRKALSPFINRVSAEIYRRNKYYMLMKRELKNKKTGCVRIYKKNNDGSYSYRIGNRIILKKRLGVDNKYGVSFISEFREKAKKVFTFSSKIYKHKGFKTYTEIKTANELTKIVRKDLCPHFPMYYGNVICYHYIIKDDYDSFKKSKSDDILESQLSYKYPKVINKNKSDKFITVFNELANGDLKYFFSIFGNDTKLLLNAFAQQILSIMFYNYYTNEVHNNIYYRTFLYHKINKGGYFHYNIFGVDYYLENLGYLWVLWDFEYSVNILTAIHNYNANKKIINDYDSLKQCYLSRKLYGNGYNKDLPIDTNIELFKYIKEYITTSNKYYNIETVDKFREYIYKLPEILSEIKYKKNPILLKTLPNRRKIINKNPYTIIKEDFFKDNKNKIEFNSFTKNK